MYSVVYLFFKADASSRRWFLAGLETVVFTQSPVKPQSAIDWKTEVCVHESECSTPKEQRFINSLFILQYSTSTQTHAFIHNSINMSEIGFK